MSSFYSKPYFCYLVGFLFPFMLTFVPFVWPVGNYGERTYSIIGMAIISFFCGLAVSIPFSFGSSNAQEGRYIYRNGATIILILWYIVGMVCLVSEFYAIGGIPMFLGNIEVARFSLQINGYIHLLAISTGFISIIFLHFSRDARKHRRLFVFLGTLGLSVLALTGNRSDVGIPFLMYFVSGVFSRDKKIGIGHVLVFAVFIFLFTAVNYYRSVLYDSGYVEMIKGQLQSTEIGAISFLYPLYMTLTYNFSVLDWLVKAGAEGVSGGIYTFYGVIALLPSKPINYGEFKNNILGNEFYSELTSTYISNLYIDYGVVGVCVGSFFLAAFLKYIYVKAKADRRYVFLYAVVFTQYVLFFYVYIYIYTYHLLIVAAAYLACRYAYVQDSEPESGGLLSVAPVRKGTCGAGVLTSDQ